MFGVFSHELSLSVLQFRKYGSHIPFRFRFRNLQPGDAVTVDDETAHCHHVAIYLGNDEVIEFMNELRRTTLTVFVDGAQSLCRVRYKSLQPTYIPEVIVDRAKAALKNPEKVGSYDVISNNCSILLHIVPSGNAFPTNVSWLRKRQPVLS